jgi:hypothetical protein
LKHVTAVCTGFIGEVTEVIVNKCRVLYNDGDEEVLTAEEVQQLRWDVSFGMVLCH